jgi:hypothetical protein
MAGLCTPDVFGEPFTVIVAKLWAAVGVNFMLVTVWSTVSKYSYVVDENNGLNVPTETVRLDKNALVEGSRVTVIVYVLLEKPSEPLTTVVMVLVPSDRLMD